MTPEPPTTPGAAVQAELRLHIGGRQKKAGWLILDIEPGPHVDFLGDCTDLGQFPDDSIACVYASHVYEHLDYQQALPHALAEVRRVLRPGGQFHVSVPDLQAVAWLLLDPALGPEQRFHLMRVVYGGQTTPHDFHRTGFTAEIMLGFLARAGFRSARRVADHGLFEDTSKLSLFGRPVSLNMIAEA
ncbi:class I SAM-dependent methyltransferase [Marinimicrococcus flavescens]|uniref:Methyltransferase domain-containing protein n=1 Tax=Marinimicrococcus flavescens TaxID=3031815 RepID=A0AAP3XRC0_9PROT|nr:methyltransferase domain-containing protein [Marinimicrococcus flavescens]